MKTTPKVSQARLLPTGSVISVTLDDGSEVPGLITHSSSPPTFFVVFALGSALPQDALEAEALFSRRCFYRVLVGGLGFKGGRWRDTGLRIGIPERHQQIPLRRPIPPSIYYAEPDIDNLCALGTPVLDPGTRETMVDTLAGHRFVEQVLLELLSDQRGRTPLFRGAGLLQEQGSLVLKGCGRPVVDP